MPWKYTYTLHTCNREEKNYFLALMQFKEISEPLSDSTFGPIGVSVRKKIAVLHRTLFNTDKDERLLSSLTYISLHVKFRTTHYRVKTILNGSNVFMGP